VTRSVVAKWVSSLEHQTALERCAKSGLPASLIYSIADIFEDAQYHARGNTKMTDARVSPLAVPDAVPRLSSAPGEIRWLSEGLGAHNDEISQDLLGVEDRRNKQVETEEMSGLNDNSSLLATCSFAVPAPPDR
jgi:crotonobetainyl-CoA:carnitine CoA-transferase CaiB-like acyl-CoA transferase